MSGKPIIEKPFGDNPVLDVLHIAYEDFVQGRLTKVEKLNKIMFNTYRKFGTYYIKALIGNIVRSAWFGSSNSQKLYDVHLSERGVEVYLNMVQNYKAEKRAQEAFNLMLWSLILSAAVLIIAFLTLIRMK